MGEITICRNCGNRFEGKYCNNCGEKKYTEQNKRIGHIVEEVLHFITHLDGTLPVSLKTMAVAPGRLSLDYTNGIRRKYFKPVSLFLLLVILYLLFPKFPGLNMRFAVYVADGNLYESIAVPVARWKMAKLHLTGDQLSALYDARSSSYAKFLLLLFLPLSAFVLRLLYFRRKRYYFDHFIFATEMISVYLFVMFLLLPALLALAGLLFKDADHYVENGPWFYGLVFLFLLVYSTVAARNFYGLKLLAALARSVLFLTIFATIIMYVYKTILYLAVMLSL